MIRSIRSSSLLRSRLLIMVFIIVTLSIISPNFLRVGNLSNMIVQQVPLLAILSFAMTMSLLIKGLDLSIGSNMALSSCVGGLAIQQYGIIPGVALSLLTGIGIGALNGLLISKVKLPSFISSYGLDWIAKGLAHVLMMGVSVYSFSPAFRQISIGKTLLIPNLIWISLLVFLILWLILNKSIFGRHIYAVGINLEAARLSGVNTDLTIFTVYSINGFLASLAGLLHIASLNAVESTIGEGWTIRMLAAVLIGGTKIEGGVGNVTNTVIGVLIMVMVTNGINLLGISSLWQNAIVGIIVVLSILLENIDGLLVGLGRLRKLLN